MKKLMLILPVLAGILWGSAGIFVRTLEAAGMSPITILGSRAAGAVVLMGLFLLVYNRSLFKIHLRDVWIFLGGGVLGMLGLNLCYNEALSRLQLSLAAVLLSLSPIFVLLMAAILFHERITRKKVVCMALALVGSLLASGLLEQTDGGTVSLGGIGIGLLAAFFYALYSIFSRLAMDKGYHIFTIIFYDLLTIFVVIAAFSDWSSIGAYAAEAPAAHGAFLVLHSACTSVLPYIFFTVALTYVETGKVSILAAGGEPVAAVVFGLAVYGEQPTVLSLFGLVVTITALCVLCMPSKPKLSEAEK